MAHTVDVLIIGAGIAGLTAAMRLKQANIDNILVLEARDRIGGRVATTVFRGVELSIGPMYVHGEANNPVARLVKQLKLPVHPPDYSTFGAKSCVARLASSGEDVALQLTANEEDPEYVLSHGDGYRCIVEHLAAKADLLNKSKKLALSTV
ncbi:unnamed protein product, partial [Dibothriocephalus latus]